MSNYKAALLGGEDAHGCMHGMRNKKTPPKCMLPTTTNYLIPPSNQTLVVQLHELDLSGAAPYENVLTWETEAAYEKSAATQPLNYIVCPCTLH